VKAASVPDYRRLAKKRVPHFLFEYLDGGSYAEVTKERNRIDLEAHTVWHINMIPGWFAVPSAVIEWVGGLQLVLGLRIRLITPLLGAVAFVAGAVHL
jgi:uncharacterized membrane protein YphA (DoxX/SURF4 family)